MTDSTLVLPRYPVAWRPIASVFLPFAAGYYLTYLFRTINALIAGRLTADLELRADDLGLLTSVFFLSLAAVQLPLGILLDRYGPKQVQITLLPIAAFGALLFGSANSFPTLMIARALIGIGVAGSLMSGLKAIALWFPQERIPLVNGCFITIGALGAVSATAPAEALLATLGWRGLFELLAITSAACALLVCLLVPDAPLHRSSAKASHPTCLKSIYCDARFWRLAPLSATCIGSAWALHGLWAAPWLRDIEGLDQSAVVQRLFVMAVAACAGALVLGLGADQWRKRRGRSEGLLTIVATAFIAAQFGLALRWPIPTSVLWGIVGAATVLSFEGQTARLNPEQCPWQRHLARRDAAWEEKPAKNRQEDKDRALDQEARQELFRLQEPCERGQDAQADSSTSRRLRNQKNRGALKMFGT